MYAVCVIWPLNLSTTIGWAAGGLVAVIIVIEYVVGLTKRLKKVSP